MRQDNQFTDKKPFFTILALFICLVFVGCSSGSYPYLIDIRNPQQRNLSKIYVCPDPIGQGKRNKLIVFVHGVLGEGTSTWGNLKKWSSWPTLMKCDPKLKDYDIFVFSYKSQALSYSSNITEVATQLRATLEHYDVFYDEYEQIHFIAHSMGGLIVKRLLVDLNHDNNKKLLQKVRSVFSLGTPANGTWMADLVGWISFNPQFSDLATADLNTYLQTLEDDWATLMHMRKRLWRFPLSYCAYETESSFLGYFAVNKISAKTYCDRTPLAVSTDHSKIVKPQAKHEEPYPWVRDRILEAAERPGLPNNTVVIMDSSLGDRIYSIKDRSSGITNADRIRELLEEQDLPLNSIKELVHANWAREEDVKEKNPALVIIHFSSFGKEFEEKVRCQPQEKEKRKPQEIDKCENQEEEEKDKCEQQEKDNCEGEDEYNARVNTYREDLAKKFRSFMESLADTDTKFLVYSRISDCSDCRPEIEEEKEEFWTKQKEYFSRHPKLKFNKRVFLYKMPCPPDSINEGSPTFEDVFTKREFACYVRQILGIRKNSNDCKCSEAFKLERPLDLHQEKASSCELRLL